MAEGLSAATNRLWFVEEPREGLMLNAQDFAEVGPERWVASGERRYVDALADFHRQVEVAAGFGEKPPRMLYFFCTVYFTAREEGFRGDLGFDVTPETRGAFGGRYYASSFLKAVILEGFGRVKEPVGGSEYMKYDGSWGYDRVPLGNRNNALVPRRSAAVHRKNSLFRAGEKFLILDPEIYNALGSLEWEVADTGGGLFMSQIDLYWGEGYPLGPWPDSARAEGCNLAVQWIAPVVIPR